MSLVHKETYSLRDGFKRAVPISVRVGEVERPGAVQGKTHWVQLEDCPNTCKIGFSHINGYEDYARQAWGFFHSMLAMGDKRTDRIDSPSQVLWLDGDGDFVTLTWEYSTRNGWKVAAIGFAYCKPGVYEAITGEPKLEKEI